MLSRQNHTDMERKRGGGREREGGREGGQEREIRNVLRNEGIFQTKAAYPGVKVFYIFHKKCSS